MNLIDDWQRINLISPSASGFFIVLDVEPPTWVARIGCRRRVPGTGARCIRHIAHRGTCLPVPRREHRRG